MTSRFTFKKLNTAHLPLIRRYCSSFPFHKKRVAIRTHNLKNVLVEGQNASVSSTLCGAPVIPSGKVEPVLHYYGIGKFIDVYCNANYTFPDETIEMRLQCQGYNLWSPSVQPCFRRTSRDTSQLRIHNGRIISRKKNNFEPGDTVTIICNAGYALSGPAEIRYIGGKKWLPAVPACSLNDFFILLISGM
ncbi:complement receptor type 2-like [Elgaria multicarinata webbii]|uniref:complement receptor type 2-like n=1 Tax=Elgaria multicarinata webbii TaxID=159646 RepID=UPI002FCD1FB4